MAVRPVRVDARVDAYIPATYVQAEALKIDLHRRIALAEHDDELRELRAATEDRYGPLPEPVENLFRIQEAKLALALVGADYLVFRGGRATVGPVGPGGERAPCAARDRRDRRLHIRPPGGRDPGRRPRRSARFGRCYRCRSPGRLSARRRLATGPSPNVSRTPRNPPVTARRLQRGLDEALARTRRRRTGRRHPRRRRMRRLRRGPRRTRSPSSTAPRSRAPRSTTSSLARSCRTRRRSAHSRRRAPPSTRRCRPRRSPTSSSAQEYASEAEKLGIKVRTRRSRRRSTRCASSTSATTRRSS